MKKIILLLAVFAMLGFVGCDNGTTSGGNGGGGDTSLVPINFQGSYEGQIEQIDGTKRYVFVHITDTIFYYTPNEILSSTMPDLSAFIEGTIYYFQRTKEDTGYEIKNSVGAWFGRFLDVDEGKLTGGIMATNNIKMEKIN